MFGIGFLFLRFTPTKKALALREKLRSQLEGLKTNGEKIRVEFLQCEIKEHNYTEERNRYGHENEMLMFEVEHNIMMLNALGDDRRNVEQVQVKQSVIIFRYNNPRTGSPEKFVSRVIPKDKLSLSIRLDNKKYTTLYVDKTNRGQYYFDLDFLNE